MDTTMNNGSAADLGGATAIQQPLKQAAQSGSDVKHEFVPNPGSAFSSNGGGRRRLSSEASLMEKVRERLATTTQHFPVPGVQAEDAILPTSEMKHNLKARTCYGKEVSISFRALLLVSFTTIMVITMLALLVMQILISRDISNSLIASCNDATDEMLDQTAEFIFTALLAVARTRLRDSAVDLQTFLLDQAQAQVGSLYNFLVSAQLERPVNQSSTAFNSTANFMSRQVLAGYSDWIDVLSLGFSSTNGYLDSSLCHVLPIQATLDSTVTGLGTCPFTISTTNLSTLVRCQIPLPALGANLGNCTTFPDFNVSQISPVQTQLQYATENPASTVPLLLWSPPYQIPGFLFNLAGQARRMIAVALSYPVFGTSCTTYGCADMFLWAAVSSRSFAGFCVSEVISSQNSSLQFATFQNGSTFYVVEGRADDSAGTLLGATFAVDNASVAIIPEFVFPSTTSNISAIANSSRYLLDTFGSFSNASLDNVFLDSFNPITMQRCNQTFTTTFPYSFSNCTLIGALSVRSPLAGPLFASGPPGRFVIVYTVPLVNLVTPLAEQYLISQQKVNEQRQHQQNSINALIGVGAGIALGAIAAGIIVAWIVAVRVSSPIKKLEKSMRNLMSFQFKVDSGEYYSRVSDIGLAERTMVKLSQAIEVFAKFVPQTVVRGIVQGKPESTRLHVEHRIVTVAFSDIKGFTSISEKLEISDLLFFLTRYLTVMTEVVELYEGVVTEILGDGLLVLWNAPDDCELHAAKACAAALAMQMAVAHLAHEFSPLLRPFGLENLAIRVGIHTGKVLAGNIGSSTKLKYGCLGDTVNTASRLEGLCKLYGVGVLCSEDTFRMFPQDKFECRELDRVQVKGKDQPLGIFEVRSLTQRIQLENRGESQATREMQDSVSTGAQSKLSLRRISTAATSAIRAARNRSTGKSLTHDDRRKSSIRSFGPIRLSDVSLAADNNSTVERYELALHSFTAGDFQKSIDELQGLAENDVPSRVLLERAKEAKKMLDDGQLDLGSWNGVNRLTEKF